MAHGRNRLRVRQLFQRKWDPIGIRGAGPDDEYDAYADKAYVMLMNERATGAAIAVYLFNVATEHMGLSDRASIAERSGVVAQILIDMRVEFETH